LVGDPDQCCGRRVWQSAQPQRDRAADSIFRTGVLDQRQVQSRKRVTERRVVRHNGDNRLKTGLEETARGFPDEQLTAVRLQQLLTTKSPR
jgi:hypothetical protein